MYKRQKYLNIHKYGDKRIIIYNGIVYENALVRFPPKDDFRANLANGGKYQIKKIEKKGVKIEYITLHIGLGTFRPVQVEDLNRHQMDSEYFEVSPKTAMAINEARKKHRKIVAVGTSTIRALETVVVSGFMVSPKRGWTDKFIYPPYEYKMVDSMVTNFHTPKSTLMMMVSAFADIDLLKKAYREAKKNDYRFLSYGDAMIII